jgi:hypothetical protein
MPHGGRTGRDEMVTPQLNRGKLLRFCTHYDKLREKQKNPKHWAALEIWFNDNWCSKWCRDQFSKPEWNEKSDFGILKELIKAGAFDGEDPIINCSGDTGTS